jgi:phage-related protein
MTTIAMPFATKVTRDSIGEVTFNAISAKFGEGYKQSAPDGINATPDKWEITIGPLTPAERDTAITALRTVGTWGIITWTPMDESVSKNFQVRDGTGIRSIRVGKLYKISFSIDQVF